MCNVLIYRKILLNGALRLRCGCVYFFNLLKTSTVPVPVDHSPVHHFNQILFGRLGNFKNSFSYVSGFRNAKSASRLTVHFMHVQICFSFKMNAYVIS